MEEERSSAMPDAFDRLLGSLHGLPDVISTKQSTVRSMTPLLGTSQLYVVQTYRQRDRNADAGSSAAASRDTIFLECASKDGVIRLAIPPAVADVIARQRDALTDKSRSKAAKAQALERKARGVVPGFMRKKKA